MVGLLRFPAWHRFDATGRIGDDERQFVRKGFLTQRVEVLGGSASTKVAEFTERFPGGSDGVALANGPILEASNNFLLTEWRLSDGREVPPVRCHHAGGFLRSSATVDIRREAALPPAIALTGGP